MSAMVSCQCGRLKSSQAKLCKACDSDRLRGDPAREICRCGRPKDRGSRVCWGCRWGHEPETTEVTCWCERDVVRVRFDDVREGLTRSCGWPECSPDLVGSRS